MKRVARRLVRRALSLAFLGILAGCYLEPEMRQSSCLINLERDGFFMDFDTSEPNLALRDQIADHFMEKFAEWKVSCAERER